MTSNRANHNPQAEAPDTESNSADASLRVFEADVVEALRHVHDPEIPVNVYDLGLIYAVSVSEANHVHVEMTLTTPSCPEAEQIPPRAKGTIQKMVPGVTSVEVNLVWEPPWTMDMMSEDAKLALGMP